MSFGVTNLTGFNAGATGAGPDLWVYSLDATAGSPSPGDVANPNSKNYVTLGLLNARGGNISSYILNIENGSTLDLSDAGLGRATAITIQAKVVDSWGGSLSDYAWGSGDGNTDGWTLTGSFGSITNDTSSGSNDSSSAAYGQGPSTVNVYWTNPGGSGSSVLSITVGASNGEARDDSPEFSFTIQS